LSLPVQRYLTGFVIRERSEPVRVLTFKCSFVPSRRWRHGIRGGYGSAR
jgi:hypothetical protein